MLLMESRIYIFLHYLHRPKKEYDQSGQDCSTLVPLSGCAYHIEFQTLEVKEAMHKGLDHKQVQWG